MSSGAATALVDYIRGAICPRAEFERAWKQPEHTRIEPDAVGVNGDLIEQQVEQGSAGWLLGFLSTFLELEQNAGQR